MPLFTPQIAPLYIGTDIAAEIGGNNQTLAANNVYLYLFELQAGQTFTGVKWRQGTTATGHTNIGVYSVGTNGQGTLVANSDTGAQVNVASTDSSFTYGTALYLAPGSYFLALANDNGTDTYSAISAMPTGGPKLSRCRQATNALAGGALPATTGVLLFGSKQPAYSLVAQNGI